MLTADIIFLSLLILGLSFFHFHFSHFHHQLKVVFSFFLLIPLVPIILDTVSEMFFTFLLFIRVPMCLCWLHGGLKETDYVNTCCQHHCYANIFRIV